MFQIRRRLRSAPAAASAFGPAPVTVIILALVAAIVLASGVAVPRSAFAQECEIPLFVKQNLVGANLMVLADNSSSMNAGVYHLDYDSETVYSGDFRSDATYFVNRDGDYAPSDFSRYWPSYPTASLVCSDNGQDGQYSGNYLNWIYYHATEDQRAAVPQTTRIQLLKEVLVDVLGRSSRLRIGLTIFYPRSDGGNILAYCEGGNEDAVLNVITSITANTYTQLGEAMETIGDYFKESQDLAGYASAVIQYPCQYNFCLVVTDGLPTMDTGVSPYLWDADNDGNDPGNCTSIGAPYSDFMNCSDHFDDVVYHLAHEDLRPDLEGDQFLYTYVVGFHENGRLLQEAADNGDGLFFLAEDYEGLSRSIEYAIQDILRRISGGSAVAVVSTERGEDDRLYRGKFMPIDWDGYLECFALPYEEGDAPLWEAGALLESRNPGTREIFTALGGTRLDFDTGSAPLLQSALGAATADEAAGLIAWGRGEPVAGLRDRQGWILGDLVHSTPVVVGAPTGWVPEPAYQDFANTHADRRRMVYVGANDGMLHAFDAMDGREVWAFVPEFALPDFAVMADSGYCHAYTCDQTASLKDVKVGGVWKTVLVGGGREGGDALFALDVTYPESPRFMWQQSVPNGRAFLSEAEMTAAGGSGCVLVGSGLDLLDHEAWLYSYGLSDGTFFGGLQLGTTRGRNKATRPAVVDLNLDGEADLLYIADLGGTLWRVQLNNSAHTSGWSVSRLYVGREEISADPVAAFGENGEVMVYFGTGAYLTDDDMLTVDPQRFVCVIDRHDGRTLSDRDLTNQTSTIEDMNGRPGWYVDLWNGPGERVTEQAVVVAGTVIFTSFAPSLNACVAGGESWLYQMAYDTGGPAPNSEDEAPEDRSIDLGEGIASYPVVDLESGSIVVQSSDASITVEPLAALYDRMSVRAWHESFQAVQ